jgi:hypothetical protein
MMRKSETLEGFTQRRAMKSLFGTRIPASIEALLKHAQVPCGLVAARNAAKSEAA